jgi:integrase
VYLYWKGQRKKRYHDIDGQPFKARYRAERLAERINSEIESEGKNFNLRKWFGASANEFAFSVYVDKWFKRRFASGEVTEEYLKTVRWICEAYWKPFFQDRDIRELKKGHFEDFLLSLPKELEPRSKKYYLTMLKKMFRDAFEREELERIPVFPQVKVPKKKIKWLTEEQRYQVMEFINLYDRTIFEFTHIHGCRPVEATRLEWTDIDFDREEITFRNTKNGTDKVHPFLDGTEEILRPIRGISGPVFRGKRAGRAYAVVWMGRIWREANQKANEKYGTPIVTMYQGQKHSRGMQLAEKGTDVLVLQKLFGHRQIASTMQYTEATKERLREVLGSGVQTGDTKKRAKPQQ